MRQRGFGNSVTTSRHCPCGPQKLRAGDDNRYNHRRNVPFWALILLARPILEPLRFCARLITVPLLVAPRMLAGGKHHMNTSGG